MSSYIALSSQTLSNAASTVTFSAIPTTANGKTIRDLVLITDITTALSNVGIRFRFNSDTGTNYSHLFMVGDGSSTYSNATTGDSGISAWRITGTTRKTIILNVFDFAQTSKHKSALIRANNPDTEVMAMSARWANTNAITSITILTNDTSNMSAGSTFSLFGIEG